MLPEIVLRLASPTDLVAITAITDAAYANYIPRLGRKPQPMTTDYKPLIDAGQIWLAASINRVVGLIVLQPQTDHLLIYSVAVDPAHQKMGVGQALLTWAETEATRQGFATVKLYTNEKMTENIALYQWLGYSEDKRASYNGFQVVYMTKTVEPPNSFVEGRASDGRVDY